MACEGKSLCGRVYETRLEGEIVCDTKSLKARSPDYEVETSRIALAWVEKLVYAALSQKQTEVWSIQRQLATFFSDRSSRTTNQAFQSLSMVLLLSFRTERLT